MIRMKVIKDPTDIKFLYFFDLRFRFVIKILRFDHERLYLEFQIELLYNPFLYLTSVCNSSDSDLFEFIKWD